MSYKYDIYFWILQGVTVEGLPCISEKTLDFETVRFWKTMGTFRIGHRYFALWYGHGTMGAREKQHMIGSMRSPRVLALEYFVSNWWLSLEIRRYGLAGRRMSLEEGSEVIKSVYHSQLLSLLLAVCRNVSSQPLLSASSILPTSMLSSDGCFPPWNCKPNYNYCVLSQQ